ncbi:MAG TPA: cyclic nucleotide-binding domain-containing protein [Treponemataceae bacterium]|jgi:anti-sigma regulatory factor (Ser/Thr protein kinase)|nr:cyclic nucleotide-binding domain-containing protein [Treponemataceae bacterium]
MKKIPIVSKTPSTLTAFKAACEKSSGEFEPVVLGAREEIVAYFNYELPEIKIIDFGDEAVGADDLMEVIHADPWLLFGGIIAVCRDHKQKTNLGRKRDPNILLILTRESFEENTDRLLRILTQNKQFLFNRGMQQQMNTNETGSFVSDNDPTDILFYCNLITSYLYNTNRLNDEGRSALQGALMELLLNAVEHGNCKIGYDEKTAWLSEGKNMLDLIEIKSKLPEAEGKKVYISYDISNLRTRISVRDDGDGFDWRKRLEAELEAGLHGMGIKLAESFVSAVSYNAKGNEASFEIPNQKDAANSIPVIMQEQQILTFQDKQVVCKEGDTSNDLFYIRSGKYAVYVQKKLVSVLTPNDMFIGEMSFLLNDRRSATIISIGLGTLVKIPKMEFITLIREHPHYGIFLSRLLAQRLARQSTQTVELRNEYNQLKKEFDALKAKRP